jgi:hypothetical protein
MSLDGGRDPATLSRWACISKELKPAPESPGPYPIERMATLA